jgi:hypothetical protein
MYGKKHTPESLLLIAKPGVLNPMWGKSHSAATRDGIAYFLIKSLILLARGER